MRLYKKSNLAKILKDLRLKSNLSQEAMAKKIGCTRQMVIGIESGRFAPQYQNFCAWLTACGMQLIIRHRTTTVKKIEMAK